MKYALTLLSLFLVACSHPSPKATVVIPEKPVDTVKYAILKFDAVRDSSYFKKGSRPALLSASEIGKIETIIAKNAIEYNKHEKAFWDSIERKFHRKEP